LEKEILSYINKTVHLLDLDLGGKVVLTEIGSGPFMYSGIIAALGGAEKVFLWSQDSSYGLANQNIEEFDKLRIKYDINTNFIYRCCHRVQSDIYQSDIICNLGFVRPIDKNFLISLNKNAVISYMAEAWEFRSEDLDLEFCKQKNIRVAGVWENHPNLQIFDKCGNLALAMLDLANFKLETHEVLIISEDNFGITIVNHFNKYTKANATCISPHSIKEHDVCEYDLVFIADYISSETIVGENGLLEMPLNSKIKIVHLAGEVKCDYALRNGYDIFPEFDGHHHRMTYTLSLLGPEPVISLHAAGLKVGELLHNGVEDPLVQILA